MAKGRAAGGPLSQGGREPDGGEGGFDCGFGDTGPRCQDWLDDIDVGVFASGLATCDGPSHGARTDGAGFGSGGISKSVNIDCWTGAGLGGGAAGGLLTGVAAGCFIAGGTVAGRGNEEPPCAVGCAGGHCFGLIPRAAKKSLIFSTELTEFE